MATGFFVWILLTTHKRKKPATITITGFLEEFTDKEIEKATFSVDFVHRGGGHAHLVGYKLEVVE